MTSVSTDLLHDPTTLLSATVVALAGVLWWLSTRRSPGLPPGPGPALPLIGHLHLVKADPRAQFAEWRRQYGDVFSLYLGSRLVVVLNGYQVMKEALVKQADAFSDRPRVPLYELINIGKGIVGSSGQLWKVTRSTSLQILREFGMGKNLLAEKLQEEINEFVKVLESKKGQPYDLGNMTQISISNNICSIVFGKRFDYDDPEFLGYLKALQTVMESVGATSPALLYPALRHIPFDPFEVKQLIGAIKVVENKFVRPYIDTHLRAFDENSVDDFINGFIREMKRQPSGTLATAEETNFTRVVIDLFAAGTDTTSTSIRWAIVYLLHNPHVQDKCYEEVIKVIGTGRTPDIKDKPEMTYLQAFIQEVLRIGDVAPLGVPHYTSSDTTLAGYVIPKGSFVLTNLDSIMFDTELWGDPEKFRPERFIGPDGKLTKPEEFVPFSLGRRVCLGESLAKMELFLYLANMIQRFRFLPPEDGTLPSLESVLGITNCPKPFLVRAVPRG